jgi:serine/threonine protein kinase
MALIADTEPEATDPLRLLCYANPEFARRYEGWEVIGRGAFATVVRVSWMGEPVAIKVFTNLNDDGKARLRSEFASTVRLTSPGVVRTYSAFDNGSIAWIEMEAVDGPNLDDELVRRERENDPFAFEEALQIAIALAGVVAEAHEAGIVHRDIKPANILLPRSRKPLVKLGDFGIARFVDAAKLTATGGFPGTPKWAAPEAFAPRPRTGPPADVYSLCLCLFALFSGNRYPWLLEDDAPPVAFMGVRAKTKPLKVRFFDRTIPEQLEGLIAQGLDRRESRRPTAADVKRLLSTLPARTPIASSLPLSPRRFAAIPPLRAGILAAVGIAGTLALGQVLRDAWSRPVAPPQLSEPTAPSLVAGREDPSPPAEGAGHRLPLGSRAESKRPQLRVDLHSGFIRITNGADVLSNVTVIVRASDAAARGHRFRLPGALSPHETVEVAVDVFAPGATGAAFRQVRLTASSAQGEVDSWFALSGS